MVARKKLKTWRSVIRTSNINSTSSIFSRPLNAVPPSGDVPPSRGPVHRIWQLHAANSPCTTSHINDGICLSGRQDRTPVDAPTLSSAQEQHINPCDKSYLTL